MKSWTDQPVGEAPRYDVVVGPPAHGGHCVARLPADLPEVGGTVVFVRHALPHERVTVALTEGAPGDRFLRADAVAVHVPSPHRVVPPCPYAGPGLCGGCDLQHVDLEGQRRWKGEVVAEQLRRLAGLDREVTVEPVPGDDTGLDYRTRMRYVRTADGGLGLRRHRSREVVPLGQCRIQGPDALVAVEGERAEPAERVEQVHGRRFTVAANGFWQAHRGAPALLVDAVLEAAEVRPGDRVDDLFTGVGLFAAFLAEATGTRGRVLAVEGDRTAARLAAANLSGCGWVEVVRGPVEAVLSRRRGRADVVVLDPPREGARRPVVAAVADRRPRTVVLVACDPASLARDVSLFAGRGYALAGLRALDLFPMTQHVEVVATLVREVS